jgi:myo-inositol 2-dehydrogenase / D-chiro-inositol 1-dehydrogenase
MSVLSSGVKRRGGATPPLAATRARSRRSMKQKFYSQVNMERIFFFEQGAFGANGRPPTEERMRFGIIGAGRIGKIHGGNVAARPDSQVLFIADADPAAAAQLAKSTGAKVGEVDAILAAKDVDAVAICSPTDTHADLIERAARSGKAIFCEKPIDLDVNRVRACLDVVKKTGATLMVGFNRRFDPNFAALRRRVAEGAIGALEIVSITSRDPSPPPISYIARSGGLFRDMMIHDFDMARFVLGEEPMAVSAMGSALVDKAIGEAGDVDTAVVIMETAAGKVAQISNSRRATYGYDQRVEAHGDKGMIRADNVRETTVEWAGAHGFASDKALNFFLERYDAAYRSELDAFISAVEAGRKPHPDGRDGLMALMLADAAYRSWKMKERASVG